MNNRYISAIPDWQILKKDKYHLSNVQVLTHNRWLESLNNCNPAYVIQQIFSATLLNYSNQKLHHMNCKYVSTMHAS
jgi:hypothetical protein